MMRDPLRPAATAARKSPSEPWAHSSAGEHHLDTVGVTGSIPVAPTTVPEISLKSCICFAHALLRLDEYAPGAAGTGAARCPLCVRPVNLDYLKNGREAFDFLFELSLTRLRWLPKA